MRRLPSGVSNSAAGGPASARLSDELEDGNGNGNGHGGGGSSNGGAAGLPPSRGGEDVILYLLTLPAASDRWSGELYRRFQTRWLACG